MMNRMTVTISPELDSALTQAALRSGTSKSHMVETFLREHKVVQRFIDDVRAEPDDPVLAPGRRSRSRARAK
jgi:hypothetical protein